MTLRQLRQVLYLIYTHGKDSCWIVTLQPRQKSGWGMAPDPRQVYFPFGLVLIAGNQRMSLNI